MTRSDGPDKIGGFVSSHTDQTPETNSDSINFFDPASAAHPQPVFRRLRERCPVGKPIPGGSVCLARYDDVLFALRHPEIFSAVMPAGLIGNKRPLIPLHVDPPEQIKYRKFLDPLFSNKNMLKMEKDVRAIASNIVSRFADDDGCEFNGAFAIPYPSTVFLRLMGLPEDDLEYFLGLKDSIIRPKADTPEQEAKIRSETGGPPRKRVSHWTAFAQAAEDRLRMSGDGRIKKVDGPRIGFGCVP